MKKEKFDFRTIQSVEDACKATGTDPESINLPGLTDDELAYRQLKLIAKAINECDESFPDWSNRTQAKWFPWFWVLPSGSGFSGSGTGDYYGGTIVGSRLCFKTEGACKYAIKQFEEIYARYLLIEKN